MCVALTSKHIRMKAQRKWEKCCCEYELYFILESLRHHHIAWRTTVLVQMLLFVSFVVIYGGVDALTIRSFCAFWHVPRNHLLLSNIFRWLLMCSDSDLHIQKRRMNAFVVSKVDWISFDDTITFVYFIFIFAFILIIKRNWLWAAHYYYCFFFLLNDCDSFDRVLLNVNVTVIDTRRCRFHAQCDTIDVPSSANSLLNESLTKPK